MAEGRRIPPIDAVLNRAARVRVRTALNPLLWLTAVVTPVCLLFGAVVGLDTSTGWLLIGLASVPVFASLIAYLGFAVADRDRLQSEEFLLRQQEIRLKEGTVISLDEVPSSEDPAALNAVEDSNAREGNR